MLTKRRVTPIYPADASVIVSLLDLDVLPTSDIQKRGGQGIGNEQPPLRILEAGTGHGSLTLHMARAVQAANGPPPSVKPPDLPGNDKPDASDVARYEEFKKNRAAVIETVEVHEATAQLAKDVLWGFRQGLYYGNVDTHFGSLAEHLERRPKDQPFAHAVLDLPGVHKMLAPVAEQLSADGKLIVYTPSITQIADCVQAIHREALPYVLDRVIELGQGMSGGREWDVRIAQIRAMKRLKQEELSAASDTVHEQNVLEAEDTIASADTNGDASSVEPPPLTETMDSRSDKSAPAPEREQAMVARPKAGLAIIGGGFIGVWRKKGTEG